MEIRTQTREEKRKTNWKRFLMHNSYGLGGFLDNFTTSAFSIRVYHFYENVLNIPGAYVAIAIIIYGIFNMLNDPFAGWLSDRPYKWIRRLGRRFPWYIGASIPFALSYLIIFTVPPLNALGMFFWLLGTICLFDMLFSLWQLNWLALFPVKFRTQEERTRVGASTTIWGIIGTVLGILVPPMIVGDYENVFGFILQGIFVAAVAVGIALLIIPGMREDEATKQRQWELIQEEQVLKKEGKKESYWNSLLFSLKQKNFMSYIIFFLGHMVMTSLMLGSLPFWIEDILDSTNAEIETYVSAALLIGVILSVPIWTWVARKLGNRKAFILGGLASTVWLFEFFFFADNLISGIIITFFLGISISAMWTLMYPGLSDVLDEIAVKTGKRNEGIFVGIRTFFGRFAIVIQAVAIGVIHNITGYDPELPATLIVQWGVRIHMSLVPALFYLLGTILMICMYNLTKEKVEDIKKELSRLNL
ncbi:MAG: MFS transporter [Candidatus Lokiarchaeota archaeon]|nr:MFS transporter [Candidatus Lokiarchaeota archaeon]